MTSITNAQEGWLGQLAHESAATMECRPLVCVRTLGGGPNKVDEAQNKQHPAANSKVVRPILIEGLQFGWKPQREAAIFEINSYGRKRENTGFESTDHQLTVDISPTDSWFLSNTTHTRLRQTSTARLLRRRMIGSEAIHTPCSVLSSAPLNKQIMATAACVIVNESMQEQRYHGSTTTAAAPFFSF